MMRAVLAAALVLLFIWLHNSPSSEQVFPSAACRQTSPAVSEQAASLLLSPLSLYTLVASTLVRIIFSAPALLLRSVYYSFLLLLAAPWASATVCLGAVLSCLQVALYLLHLGLVVAAVAIVALARHKMAAVPGSSGETLCQWEKRELSGAGPGAMLARKVAYQS